MNVPAPTVEQRRLFQELILPNQEGKRIKRFNIRKLLSDPRFSTLRRYIQTTSVMTIQAREGVDTDFKEVYSIVVKGEKKL